MNIKEARHAKNAAQKTRRTTRVLAQEFAHITIKKALTALYSGGNFRGVGLGICDNQAVPRAHSTVAISLSEGV